ncbi:hypothetical protein NEMBOFW57_001762 [Staphylotrichum longicolle]|uniref:Uncharacterized protein n=1 Tax=Staphylotrichum longicolle TaxID=669026 RepID=A0AAD4F513_9PEZI|nr:hypothetical protein NEMBOFW57_001762 [Staphylotrichum longicolle]
MQEEQDAWAQQSSTTQQCSETGTQIHHTAQLTETDFDSAKGLEYSESVYSSDDEEHAPVGSRNRTMALDTPAMYHREASAASSVDWKTWLSANICKFEPSPSPSKPSETEPDFTPPTMVQSHFSSLRGHPNIPSPSPLRRSLKRITPAPPTSLLLPADKDKEKEKENESPGDSASDTA